MTYYFQMKRLYFIDYGVPPRDTTQPVNFTGFFLVSYLSSLSLLFVFLYLLEFYYDMIVQVS